MGEIQHNDSKMRSSSGPQELLALEQQAHEPSENGLGFSVEKAKDAAQGLSFGKMFHSLLEALKPEILTRRRHATRRPLSPTAWLDGLRGWAAFIVCIVHLSVYTHSDIEYCYAQDLPEDGSAPKFTPASWPFVRIWFSGGHAAVMLFYTISGYVLTKKMISLLHEGRRDDFVEAVNSAIVRRPLRLYYPVLVSTLCFGASWHIFNIHVPWPPRQSNIFMEFGSWLAETLRFTFIFRNGFLFHMYNIHTWTIPVELRGSFLVYVWLFAMHRVSHRLRILLTAAIVVHMVFFNYGSWYACFYSGMLTVELDLLASSDSTVDVKLPWDGIMKALKRRPVLRQILLHAMLAFGLHLAGEPSSDWKKKDEILGDCPGWRTLSTLIPPAYDDGPGNQNHRWFWLFWCAWFLVISIKEIGWARRLFETNFSQCKYIAAAAAAAATWALSRLTTCVLDLGKHSFALYLVHGPMIGILSERLFYLVGLKQALSDVEIQNFAHLTNKRRDASWWPFSPGGTPGFEPNFLVCVAISVPVFLYVAELGTKFFDAPSVHFARWAYNKMKVPSSK